MLQDPAGVDVQGLEAQRVQQTQNFVSFSSCKQGLVVYRIVLLSADIKMENYKIITSFISSEGPR